GSRRNGRTDAALKAIDVREVDAADVIVVGLEKAHEDRRMILPVVGKERRESGINEVYGPCEAQRGDGLVERLIVPTEGPVREVTHGRLAIGIEVDLRLAAKVEDLVLGTGSLFDVLSQCLAGVLPLLLLV